MAAAVYAGIAAGYLPAGFLQVFPEIVGAGKVSVFVGEMFGLGTAAQGESASELGIGRQVRGVQVQAVARSPGAGDAVVERVHPGRLGVDLRELDGASGLGTGRYVVVDGVFIEAQGVGAGGIVGAHVIVVPGGVLQVPFVGTSVANDAPVDALDAGLPEEGLPLPEQGFGPVGNGVGRADGGISPAHNVEVPFQRPVFNAAGVAQAGLETVIWSKGVQGAARRDQFGVGSGRKPRVGAMGCHHVSGHVPHHDAHRRARKGAFAGRLTDVLLQSGLCLHRKGRKAPRQNGNETFHNCKITPFFA